jgi:hypothetical protein
MWQVAVCRFSKEVCANPATYRKIRRGEFHSLYKKFLVNSKFFDLKVAKKLNSKMKIKVSICKKYE